VQLVFTSGKSRNAIARALGISTETLRQWIKQADSDAGVRHDGLTTEETAEVRRWRRLLRQRPARTRRRTPVTAFEFVEREKAQHPVARLCRVLGVCTSGHSA
jgi:transposase-like protein